jgi:hypothetical protein
MTYTEPDDCGLLGRPDPNPDVPPEARIRLYTRNECEDHLKGIWFPNGECARQEGGTFSAMCAHLNSSWKASLYSWRWYIGGAVAVGGYLAWQRRRK